MFDSFKQSIIEMLVLIATHIETKLSIREDACSYQNAAFQSRNAFIHDYIIATCILTMCNTGYSSVGRASDCSLQQQSDGPWFDSGWPDFHVAANVKPNIILIGLK